LEQDPALCDEIATLRYFQRTVEKHKSGRSDTSGGGSLTPHEEKFLEYVQRLVDG